MPYYGWATYLSMLFRVYNQSVRSGLLLTLYYLSRLARSSVMLNRVARFRCSHGLWFYDFLHSFWVYAMNRHYEEKTISLFIEESTPRDVFYDIGANIGFYSVHVGVQGSRVVAFEPDPRAYKLLQRNLKAYGVEYSAFRLPLCDRDRSVTLYLKAKPEHNSLVEAIGAVEEKKAVCHALDSLLGEGNIKPPTLVKIDVEGAETLVVKGMEGALRRWRPRIVVVEVDYRTIGEVVEVMERSGYTEDSLLDKWDGRRNVLFTPKT